MSKSDSVNDIAILLVDDAAPMRNAQRNILTKHGYTVVGEAINGMEAIVKYRELKPTLVIMDITLPDIDGIQATREIISFDNTAKIIMCSAVENKPLEVIVNEAKQAGALDFIVKPFKAETLLEKVASAISFTFAAPKPSPEVVKELIAMYHCADTQTERDRIIMPLLYYLSNIPLIFPTDAVIPQSAANEFKNLKRGDSFSFSEDVGGKIVSFQQDGITYVPAFTDNAAQSKSDMPFSLYLNMHPSSYIPILRSKTYDKVVINPEEGVGMFALPKELFEKLMAKSIKNESDASQGSLSTSPVKQLSKFVMCNEDTERVSVRVWAEITGGRLKISGQDLGNAPMEAFGQNEYEYFYDFDKNNTERLIMLLLGGKERDIKEMLLERFSGMDGCKNLRAFCERNRVEFQFHNWF